MPNSVSSLRRDIVLRCTPALGGIVCLAVALRMTVPSQSLFVILVLEGLALIGLAVFLVWRYLKTPA